MKSLEMPRRIHRHLSIQQIGTETLIYDEQRHKAFCLNEISSILWRLSDGEHTVAQISAAASLQLSAPVTEEIVQFALEEFQTDGLIEPPTTPATPKNAEPAHTSSRRDILQKLGVGAAMLLPVVAAIVAPTAAQAYGGCFDCGDSRPTQAVQLSRSRQQALARSRQPGGTGASDPLPDSAPAFSPFAPPAIDQPINIDPKLQQ